MSEQMIFKRYETKFMLTASQRDSLLPLLKQRMRQDSHPSSKICSIYFDTPTYQLIRRSIEKPIFKEKLRLRGYGHIADGDICFLEIKRKYKHVVYKRRIAITAEESLPYLDGTPPAPNGQIEREISYMFSVYKNLAPRLYLSYERSAMVGLDDPTLRLTLDTDILWRTDNLSLTGEYSSAPLLDESTVLMEVKSSGAIPLWLTDWLTKNRIYKCSFSKYGTVYTNHLMKELVKSENF